MTGVYLHREAQQYVVKWIYQNVKSQEKELGVHIHWDHLSISFVPLKVKMQKVRVDVQNKSLFYEPVTMETLVISPDYLSFLKGRLAAEALLIKPAIKMSVRHLQNSDLDVNRKSSTPLELLKELEFLPGFHFHFKEASLFVQTRTQPMFIDQVNAHIRLSHPFNLSIQSESDVLEIGAQPLFSFSLNIAANKEAILLKEFKIKNDRSWVELIAEQSKKSYGVKIESSFFSEDVNAFIWLWNPDFQPPYSGKVSLDGFLQNKESILKGHFEVLAENLSIEDMFMSNVKAAGIIENNVVTFNDFYIRHPDQWDIRLPEMKVSLQKPYSFETRLQIINTRLSDVFETVRLSDVPVFALLDGELECAGQFLETFAFDCGGKTDFKNIIVKESSQLILKAPYLKAQSQFHLSNGSFTVSTEGQMGEHSNVTFKSVLDDNGTFSAWFEGVMDFNDIDDLMDLSPEGIVHITNGTIHSFKEITDIQADLQIENLVISEFIAGNLKARFNYTQKEILHFRNISGRIQKSNYTGNVSIDISKDTIKSFINFPHLQLAHLKYALKDRVRFPFDIRGSGTLTAYLDSPLQVNALSYNLQSRFSKIVWERELFDSAIIEVKSEKGFVETQKVELLKNKGKITLTGSVNPKGYLQARLKGSQLKLQESQNWIQLMGPGQMTGIADFDMDLKGDFMEPLTTARVTVKDSFFIDHSIADSNMTLRIRSHRIEVAGSVADKIDIQSFIFPYSKEGVVHLKANARNLNLNELFFSKSSINYLYNQFQSDIHGECDISYKRNQLTRSINGYLKVGKLVIQSQAHTLTSTDPFSVRLNRGYIRTDPILLASGNQVLRIFQNSGNGIINVIGDMKLDFSVFLLPVLRSLAGDMKLDLNFQPEFYNLQPKGQIQFRKAFVQLTDTLEPFEDIYSDMYVNGQLLKINSLYAGMGTGRLQATGHLLFGKKGLVPVDIKGSFERVRFTSLPGIFAQGSGQLSFTGDRFPYTLGLVVNISDSRMEREIVASTVNQTRLSSLLPKESKKTFEPIFLDLKLSFDKPALVENSLVNSSVTGNLHIKGVPGAPLMTGTVQTLSEGTITFREHEFNILSAQITYKDEPPANPEMDITARTTVSEYDMESDVENEYDILLRVRGSGYSPEIILSSTPDLTENEIASLLAFGTRSIVFETGSTVSDTDKYSYYYYQLGTVMFEGIGRELKDTLGMDQFSMVSYRNPKKSSTSTKLTVGKKVLDNLTVSASQTFLEDNPESDIKAEYKIQNNVSFVGFWRNEEQVDASDIGNNTMGFDLEYQLDF